MFYIIWYGMLSHVKDNYAALQVPIETNSLQSKDYDYITIIRKVVFVVIYCFVFSFRGIGRDILMFGASVFLIRVVLLGIVEGEAPGPA